MRDMKHEKLSSYSVRIPGPTPNGGSYAILYYKGSEDGSVATPETAVGIEAIEYDSQGNAISRTYLEKGKAF